MSTELADNIRKYRRRAGLSQEELAHQAELSVGTIRRVEQGGDVRIETLHQVARVLGVRTSQLLASDAPEPVRHGEANVLNLRDLRIALTPPLSLAGPVVSPQDEPHLRHLRHAIHDGAVLYHADSYRSIATLLPKLVRDANAAVTYYAGSEEEHRQALLARAEALRLAGLYLTQVRQFDIAHTALTGAITDAQAAGDLLAAGSGVGAMCWLLLRQSRFDEAEQIASASMEQVEPKITGATPDEYAVWGGLAMEAAAAAVRNNRPAEARDYRQAASVAGAAVGTGHRNLSRHWSVFGPVTVAMKALEDPLIMGDARTVLRKASEEEALSAKAWKRLGKPSSNDGNRFALDVARAHVRTGDATAAMEELSRLRQQSPTWLSHQSSAGDTIREIMQKRKRTLTSEMREVAAHLGVVA
jgi:transcriptional regulator with XRE-family HTH domain